jgi:hypothetical protein
MDCAASWPANIDHIEALLRIRSAPATRNWRPGETIHDLLRENFTHGILPPVTDLEILGDRITIGLPALMSAPTHAIGRAP